MLNQDEATTKKLWKKQVSRAHILPSVSFNVTYIPFQELYGVVLKQEPSAVNLGIVSTPHNGSIFVVMHSEEWFRLAKKAGYMDRTECPHCLNNHIKKNGHTWKGDQLYYCHQCKEYFNQHTKTQDNKIEE